jgi:Predicted phosphoesterases, related to the Icc protein
MRIYFATDVHGSEICWRKFLGAAKHYDAEVLVLGGDMTGKALVPIIDDGDGKWHSTLLENKYSLNGEEEVSAFEDRVIKRGYYPFRTNPDELRALSDDEPRWHALFQEKMLGTVEKWMSWRTSGSAEPGSASSAPPATTTSSRSTT